MERSGEILVCRNYSVVHANQGFLDYTSFRSSRNDGLQLCEISERQRTKSNVEENCGRTILRFLRDLREPFTTTSYFVPVSRKSPVKSQ